MLYKTGFVSISATAAEWQATQNCVTDRHKIFPLTAIAPILNGGWGQKELKFLNDTMAKETSHRVLYQNWLD